MAMERKNPKGVQKLYRLPETSIFAHFDNFAQLPVSMRELRETAK